MKIEEMISANRADCSGCEACANICPRNAIVMTRDAEGFAYPKITLELCIGCGRCDKICPALNFRRKILAELPETFAATYDDDKILRHSSSGGVFTALSESVLQSGGVVFGAAFDKNWHVHHRAAKNLDELENLRGSKYVQSQIGDVYKQVREALDSKKVLFSGTPCQCAGLKHFLGEEPDNLLTVEIICYGVPSPALWEYYIGELGHKNEIAHVNFQNKRNGWGSVLEINFFDRAYYSRPLIQELYGRNFLNNLILRPSCHGCRFKIPNGQSDLTLGDAWGVKDFAPTMFDKRGVSVVFIHTAKGREFFEKTNLRAQRVKFFEVAAHNKMLMISACADERRGSFFADFARVDDKIAVMEKYFYQDEAEFNKKRSVNHHWAFQETYQGLAAQIRQRFERNILVIALTLSGAAQKNLEDFFENKFRNCGIYFLNSTAQGQFICIETFSRLSFDLKDGGLLPDFFSQFNITEILIDDKLAAESSEIVEWLRSFSLPLQTFSPEMN